MTTPKSAAGYYAFPIELELVEPGF